MEKRVIAIIVLIIIAAVIVGFSLFQYARTPGETGDEPATTTPATTTDNGISYPAITPEEVVEAFYAWYLTDTNALPSTAFEERTSLTQAFKGRVTDKMGATDEQEVDLFTCTAVLPQDISVTSTQIFGERALVSVDATVSDVEAVSYTVDLILTDGAWKIDNVTCNIKG